MTSRAIGPDGAPVVLPDPNGRWTPKRKAMVIAALRAGMISEADAMRQYAMTPSEIASLSVNSDAFGVQGLRVTHTQQYRRG